MAKTTVKAGQVLSAYEYVPTPVAREMKGLDPVIKTAEVTLEWWNPVKGEFEVRRIQTQAQDAARLMGSPDMVLR